MIGSWVWMPNRSILAICLSFALAACGGNEKPASSSNSSGNGNASGTTPGTSSPPPAIAAFIYEGITPATSRAQFLSNLNTQGTEGFRYLSDFAFAATPPDQTSAFVKDLATTYSYEVSDVTVGGAAFVSQANSEGSRGFRWAGELAVNADIFYLYRKDNSSSATYSYTVLAQPSTQGEFLTQANAQGAIGFYDVSPSFSLGDASASAIYEKNAESNATYGYEIKAVASDDAGFIAQLNSEGLRGYRFRTGFVFSDGNSQIFAKDLSQSSTFSFYGLDPAASSTAYIQQANGEGAKGNGLVGEFALPSTKIETLYFIPGACSGMLCTSVSSFGI